MSAAHIPQEWPTKEQKETAELAFSGAMAGLYSLDYWFHKATGCHLKSLDDANLVRYLCGEHDDMTPLKINNMTILQIVDVVRDDVLAKEKKEAAAKVQPAATMPAKIIYHGDMTYTMGPHGKRRVTENEDNVLLAFLEKNSMNHGELCANSGFTWAPTVLGKLQKKYPESGIRMAREANSGGYFVPISAAT